MRADDLFALLLPAGGVWTFLLVLARVAGLFTFLPWPGARGAPDMAKAVLALGLASALYPLAPVVVAAPGALPGTGALVVALAAEAALGLSLGLAVATVSEGLLIAAQILGFQAGYSYASSVDPTSQADSSVLQIMAQLGASLLFFSTGLDRQVIGALAGSLARHPPGQFHVSGSVAEALIQLGAGALATGLRLALPVVAFLLLVDLALALVGKVNAHLQLLTLAFPVKMLLALALLAGIVPLTPTLYEGAARRALALIEVLLG